MLSSCCGEEEKRFSSEKTILNFIELNVTRNEVTSDIVSNTSLAIKRDLWPRVHGRQQTSTGQQFYSANKLYLNRISSRDSIIVNSVVLSIVTFVAVRIVAHVFLDAPVKLPGTRLLHNAFRETR